MRGTWWSFQKAPGHPGGLASGEEPGGGGSEDRGADEGEREWHVRHVNEGGEVVRESGDEDEVGARGAQEDSGEGENAGGGRGEVTADGAGGTGGGEGAQFWWVMAMMFGISGVMLAFFRSKGWI